MHERVVGKIIRVHRSRGRNLESIRNLKPFLVKQNRLATGDGKFIQDDNLICDKTLIILIKCVSVNSNLKRGFNVRIDNGNQAIGASGKALIASLGEYSVRKYFILL